MKTKIVFQFILSFFISAPLLAQEIKPWFSYLGNHNLNDKLNFHNELQVRNINSFEKMDQVFVRIGVGHNISPNNNNVLLGYGTFFTNSHLIENARYNIEHRVFQQFITKQRFGHLFLNHRYRYEQRFLPNEYKDRFRYFLAGYFSINQLEIIKGTYYLAGYNEIFLNTRGQYFDQNRLYLGAGYAITNNIKIEAAYLRQTFNSGYKNIFQITVFNNNAFKMHK